jgi:transcriptional regulator with XRE-family HTH domain
MSGLSGDARSPGAWLRRQRTAAGLTQEELADRSGLSVRAISSLERGRTSRPHPHSLRRVASGLGLAEAAVSELIACYRGGQASEPEHSEPEHSQPEHSQPEHSQPKYSEHGRTAAGPVVVPRQLPAAAAPFAGRTAELAILGEWLEGATRNGPGRAVVISTIGGMAGAGKTALALHWAHRVADRFPDGQLYANLRGYDPSGQPAEAAEVVRGFLQGLGVVPEQIPASLDARTALYRSLLAGRRMLIVVDNARNPAQVRPLLPGAPGSVVLVTSRNHLGGLAATEGARILNLDVLSEADAAELLSARLGRDRVAAEPDAVAELIRLCARLPLALAIVAARADVSGWPLTVLAGQLADARERLGLLGLDDSAADVRAVFSWSFCQLSGESAGMFRLLAVHPGPDISVAAAASIAGVPAPRAQALLHELAEASMLGEYVPGRYLLHDLLRAYAAEQADPDAADTEGCAGVGDERATDGEGPAAARRVLEHYLHAARTAARALDPAQPAAPDPPGPGVTREAMAGSDEALAWFDAEHNVLLAIMSQAGSSGSDDYVRQIAWTLEPFFVRRGNWQDLTVTEQIALACSERLADPAGQARAHLYLGRALAGRGQADPARAHLAQAAELFRALGDHSAEARAHLADSAIPPAGRGPAGARSGRAALQRDGGVVRVMPAISPTGEFPRQLRTP